MTALLALLWSASSALVPIMDFGCRRTGPCRMRRIRRPPVRRPPIRSALRLMATQARLSRVHYGFVHGTDGVTVTSETAPDKGNYTTNSGAIVSDHNGHQDSLFLAHHQPHRDGDAVGSMHKAI